MPHPEDTAEGEAASRRRASEGETGRFPLRGDTTRAADALTAAGALLLQRSGSASLRRRTSSLLCFCCFWLVSLEVQAGELRDPFVFGPRTDVVEQASPVLVGVLWDATNPLAVVGEEAVKVGDVVGEWQVVKIEQNGIVVQRSGRREFIAPGTRLPNE